MAYNYYYIDDDPISTIEETAKGLSIYPSRLIIKAYQHNTWHEQLKFITKNQELFDGLLLDWRLKKRNQDEEEADYNVEALAQQLRGAIIERTTITKDFPIILCSADVRFDEIYSKDVTGHDLFDFVIKKDDFNDKIEETITRFEDLAEGYKIITVEKSVEKIFQIEDLSLLDYRVLHFMQNITQKSVHEVARFILNKILNVSSFLINEHLLASRLGIDIIDSQESKENWVLLLNILSETKYSGLFSKGWNRWWMPKIDTFWNSRFEASLGAMNASERVAKINQKFNLKLRPAIKSAMSCSEYFWTICKETNRPLAIEDGILSSMDYESVPWQEDEYYSPEAILESGIRNINPLEKERVQMLKKKFSKVRSYESK